MMVIRGDRENGWRFGLEYDGKESMISNTVVSSLGLETEVYDGPSVFLKKEIIEPLATANLQWQLREKDEIYKTRCLVIPDESSYAFDILLTNTDIANIGFDIEDESKKLRKLEAEAEEE